MHVLQIATGSLLVQKSFEELKEKDKIENYNWELGEKIFPTVSLLSIILIYGRFVLFLAYFYTPKVSRVYFVFIALF